MHVFSSHRSTLHDTILTIALISVHRHRHKLHLVHFNRIVIKHLVLPEAAHNNNTVYWNIDGASNYKLDWNWILAFAASFAFQFILNAKHQNFVSCSASDLNAKYCVGISIRRGNTPKKKKYQMEGRYHESSRDIMVNQAKLLSSMKSKKSNGNSRAHTNVNRNHFCYAIRTLYQNISFLLSASLTAKNIIFHLKLTLPWILDLAGSCVRCDALHLDSVVDVQFSKDS